MHKPSIKPIYEDDTCVGYRYFLDDIPIAYSFWDGQRLVGAIRADYQEIVYFPNFHPMPVDEFKSLISLLGEK